MAKSEILTQKTTPLLPADDTSADIPQKRQLNGTQMSGENNSEDKYVAPDGGWAWVVMFGNWIINIIVCGIALSSTMFYQAMLSQYKQTPTATAYIFSIHQTLRYMSSRYTHAK